MTESVHRAVVNLQEKDIIAAKENAVANAVQIAALQKSTHHPWAR